MTKSTTRETADIAGVVGKNAIINGNFDIWQRATSQTASGYGSDDRWYNASQGSTQVASRQAFTLGQTDVPNNPRYYARTVVTSVAGVSSRAFKFQRIEGVEAFAGTTATLSFWAKADANKNIAVEFQQYFGTGGSPSATVTGIGVTTIALTTSWVKHTVSVAIPSIATDPLKVLGSDGNDALQLNLWMDAGSNWNARTFSQVQIEAGSVATEFEPRTVGEELALCQRYFQSTGVLAFFVVARFTAAAGLPLNFLHFENEMRASPTLSTTGAFQTNTGYGGTPGFSNITSHGCRISGTVSISASAINYIHGGTVLMSAEL